MEKDSSNWGQMALDGLSRDARAVRLGALLVPLGLRGFRTPAPAGNKRDSLDHS